MVPSNFWPGPAKLDIEWPYGVNPQVRMSSATADTAPTASDAAATFIARWSSSGAAERANYQLFLSELCDLIGVPRPDPTRPDDTENAYVFERSVTFYHPDGTTSTGRIDLYKRACFVLEAKQGVERRERVEALAEATKAKAKAAKKGHAQRGSAAWDEAMLKARGQAEQYARSLPACEGRPPLLIVVDVGHSIELYSEFSRTGGTYVPFPDPQSHRIRFNRLSDADVRERLRLAWTDPQSLDPAKRTARVTREIAQKLGLLASSLEKSGHSAEAVATFLMRALFTMFAEDVELLPKESFVNLLKSLHGHSEQFVPMIEELWGRMKTGGFSTVLREKIRHFNGGLFEQATALPLTADQFDLLIEASKADWRDVEPAIFGTLLERALDTHERHKLGAHYTPRAYVERLVMPAVIEPLRAEWLGVRTAAIALRKRAQLLYESAEARKVSAKLTQDCGDYKGANALTDEAKKDTAKADAEIRNARAEINGFHHKLCRLRVLDPACGSGNFLYVALQQLKLLEGEVIDFASQFGEEMRLDLESHSVDPQQFLGLEVNPRAAAIAELVLWIGYLQWHFRTRGRVFPPEPIIKAFHNIECRDAVLAYDRSEPVLDEQGQPVTRWDGRTLKKHFVTGEDVPDETARVPILSYVNPRPAEWPKADFIVGNPPFIGKGKVREALGDGYVETLREMYPDVPDSADFVMYWWQKAALIIREGKAVRFGFITTNSLRQSFNRRVVEHNLGTDKLGLRFAIPDHPWVDSADGAAVRIAMTVVSAGQGDGRFIEVVDEIETGEDGVHVTLTERTGLLHANLTIGANAGASAPLESNSGLTSNGMMLGGRGFLIQPSAVLEAPPEILRPILNGNDIVRLSRNARVIDFFGLTADEALRRAPAAFQQVRDRVKPERDSNRRSTRREKWWLFSEVMPQQRRIVRGLSRYIGTPETAKHRIFVFLPTSVVPEHPLICIGLDDAFYLGVLSSHIHKVWALATGGTLEDRPRYNKSLCFDPFPFPAFNDTQRAHIRDLGERLDSFRKSQQAQHARLTLTDLYNVLDKVRTGDALSPREQLTHNQGLVSVLRELHDQLDEAVADVYGLPATATNDAILTRLCTLNIQRTAEERAGTVRYLRPEFQNPNATSTQTNLAADGMGAAAKEPCPSRTDVKPAWPKSFAEQALAVRTALTAYAGPADAATLAKTFKGAKADRIDDILETLASLGQARILPTGKFLPA